MYKPHIATLPLPLSQRIFLHHSASSPPFSPAFAPFRRRSHRTSANLRPPPDIYTTTPQRTFIYQHTHAPPQHYTPSPSKPRTNSTNSAHLHQATYVRLHSFLTEEGSCCTMGTERSSHTNKSLLLWCPRGCTEAPEKSL